MRNTTRKVLAAFTSAMVVLSLVPAQGMAEAIREVADAGSGEAVALAPKEAIPSQVEPLRLQSDGIAESDQGDTSLEVLYEGEGTSSKGVPLEAESSSESLPYIAEDGNVAYIDGGWTEIVAPVTAEEYVMGDGWYVLSQSVEFAKRVRVSGNAKLLLCDGCTFTCKEGIVVASDAHFSVYGQQGGSGALKATGTSGQAGIGGASGYNCGSVSIYGGNVTATGGNHGAGIGGGDGASAGGVVQAIEIYRGSVTARGGSSGAGIGSGYHGTCADIEIAGGTVVARGGDYAAGIGGGNRDHIRSFVMTGGDVDAMGGTRGAGIGSGGAPSSSSGAEIVITGGSAKAVGGDQSAGIGGGGGAPSGKITISGRSTKVHAQGDIGEGAAAIGGGRGGAGEEIRILDDAYVWTFTKKGYPAIGAGKTDSNDNGILEIYDLANVYLLTKDDVGFVSADERESWCRTWHHVEIKHCDHDGAITPTPDKLHHTVACGLCKAPTYAMFDHEYDGNGLCRCGVHRYVVTVRPGTGGGTAQTQYLYQGPLQEGADYTTPVQKDVPFSPPAGASKLLYWKIDDVLYSPGRVLSIKKDITLTAVWNTPWQEFQLAIDRAEDGETITLADDMQADPAEQPLTVPEGKTVTIDLAGHTLDRGLAAVGARDNGNVLMNKGVLTIRNGTITGGNAKYNGGGIYSKGRLTLQNVTISGNAAGGCGGGVMLDAIPRENPYIYDKYTTVTINSCTISHNAAASGGGIYVLQPESDPATHAWQHSDIIVERSMISDNVADYGGAVYYEDGYIDGFLYIERCTCERNQAIDGGAVYNDKDTWLYLTDCLIQHNEASRNGGAVYNNGRMECRSTLSQNEAKNNGGAVYVGSYNYNHSILSSTITNNVAGNAGGGAFIELGAGSTRNWCVGIADRLVIRDNTTADGKASNLYIPYGKSVTRNEFMDSNSSIGVTCPEVPTAEKPVVITTSGFGSTRAECFVSDNESYVAGVNADGDAILGLPATVSFDAGGGSGAMEAVTAPLGGAYKTPACGFDPPEHCTFAGWRVNDKPEVFVAGTRVATDSDMTLTAVWHTLWADLQMRVDAAENGDTVTLLGDTVAGSDDGALSVAEGKDVTLDLAGHVLDRGLVNADPREDGSVIVNDGTLAITGSGTITGGNTVGDGGGIYNAGTLAIDEATIDGNAAKGNGGGIYNAGKLTLEDASITGNAAELQGGGVLQDGQMSLAGSPVVVDNVAGQGSNVYLRETHDVMDVTDALGASTHVGVTTAVKPGDDSLLVFTSGLKGRGNVSAFVSDDADCAVGASEEGEALLGRPVTVRFDAGSGRGQMADVVVAKGGWWEIPACAFVGAMGSTFAGWTVDDQSFVRWPGQRVQVVGDTSLRATWELGDPFWFPSFKTVSLVLSGQIGVNFFADLSKLSDAERASCRMTFEVDGEEREAGYDAGFADATTGRYHGFTCYVSSIQMAEPIRATLHYKDQTQTMTYSVTDYIAYVERNKARFDEATVALVEAIADYGHYAQPFLAAQNGWTVGVDHAEMTMHYAEAYDHDAVAEGLAGHAPQTDLGTSNVKGVSCRLILGSETALELYLDAGGSEVVATGTFGQKTYEAERQKDGRYVVRVPNVSAHELGKELRVEGVAGGAFSASVSAMSYARAVVAGDTYGADAKDAMCALAAYYSAATAYREVH